jgi:hypothetical protein
MGAKDHNYQYVAPRFSSKTSTCPQRATLLERIAGSAVNGPADSLPRQQQADPDEHLGLSKLYERFIMFRMRRTHAGLRQLDLLFPAETGPLSSLLFKQR